MPSQRFNHLIFQKTTRDKQTTTLLRGCFSSNRKAGMTFQALRDEEVERLSRFSNSEPLCTEADGRVTLTVNGFQSTIFLLKVPQDVSIANTI